MKSSLSVSDSTSDCKFALFFSNSAISSAGVNTFTYLAFLWVANLYNRTFTNFTKELKTVRKWQILVDIFSSLLYFVHYVFVYHEIFMANQSILIFIIFVKAFLSLFIKGFCLTHPTKLDILLISELKCGARLPIFFIIVIF